MQKDKNKKKTLTISSSFTKKFNPSSFGKTSKKSYVVDKKKMSNLLSSLTKIFHLILLLKVAKITGILIGNLLSNRQQKGLLDQIKIKKMKLIE